MNLRANPDSGPSPLTVWFDAEAIPGDCRTIVEYSFDFGDGSPVVTQSTPSVTHVYSVPYSSAFTAYVTVTDNGGESMTASHGIAVEVPVDADGVDISSPGYSEAEEDDLTDPIEIVINSDDDNEDTVQDQAQAGPIAQEDDLLPLDLSFPMEDGELEFAVAIDAGAQDVRIWLDEQKTTELQLQPLSSGSEPPYGRKGVVWTLPYDAPPARLYAEGVGASLGAAGSVPVRFSLTLTSAFLGGGRGDSMSSVIRDPRNYVEGEGGIGGGYSYRDRIREINRNHNPNRTGVNTRGVMLSIGDSNTANRWYAPTYTGKSANERAILNNTHYGTEGNRDGWWLASTDVGGRDHTHTAAGGMTIGELLDGYRTPGGHQFRTLAQLLQTYNPEFVVLMIGTNDARRERFTTVADYEARMRRALDAIIANGTIPIIVTLPPLLAGDPPNAALRQRWMDYDTRLVRLAREYRLPLIEFYPLMMEMADQNSDAEIRRRYLEDDGVHLSARPWGSSFASRRNLSTNGQMLHIWAVVNKMHYVWAALGR